MEAAGLEDKVEIRVGPALAALQAMPAEPTFDFAYLDADKEGYPDYYEEIVPRLTARRAARDRQRAQGAAPCSTPTTTAAAPWPGSTSASPTDDRVESVLLALADGLTLGSAGEAPTVAKSPASKRSSERLNSFE